MGLAAYALTLCDQPAVLEVAPGRALRAMRAAEAAPRSQSLHSPRAWLYAALVILLSAVTHLCGMGSRMRTHARCACSRVLAYVRIDDTRSLSALAANRQPAQLGLDRQWRPPVAVLRHAFGL